MDLPPGALVVNGSPTKWDIHATIPNNAGLEWRKLWHNLRRGKLEWNEIRNV